MQATVAVHFASLTSQGVIEAGWVTIDDVCAWASLVPGRMVSPFRLSQIDRRRHRCQRRGVPMISLGDDRLHQQRLNRGLPIGIPRFEQRFDHLLCHPKLPKGQLGPGQHNALP